MIFSENFNNDLARAHLSLISKQLSCAFDTLRLKSKKNLSLAINKSLEYDKDNPIFYPVSLFRPLDMGRLEIAHTKTLAWLLKPKAEHGFGVYCLKQLLTFLSKHHPQDNLSSIDACPEGSLVLAEKRTQCGSRIDVWAKVFCRKSRSNWLIVIEAKISHTESSGQLAKYDQEIKRFTKENPDAKVVRLFLTTDRKNHTTSKEHWVPITYEDIFVAFWKNSKLIAEKPGYQFLRLYLSGLLSDLQSWHLPLDKENSNPYIATTLLRKISDK